MTGYKDYLLIPTRTYDYNGTINAIQNQTEYRKRYKKESGYFGANYCKGAKQKSPGNAHGVFRLPAALVALTPI